MSSTPIRTYSMTEVTPLYNGDDAPLRAIKLKASTTFPAGTLVGEITASPGTFGAYASGNSDGTQNPSRILRYPCVTDASGNITVGDGSAGNEWGATQLVIPAYVGGIFAIADIPNQDAAGLAKCGRLLGNGEFVLTAS